MRPCSSRLASGPARVPVRSQPLGATVLVDGVDSGVTTNGVLVLPSPVPEQVELRVGEAAEVIAVEDGRYHNYDFDSWTEIAARSSSLTPWVTM